MSEQSPATGGSGPTHRSLEIALAIAMILFALIVIAGSLQAGIGWASDGPRAGFFPFYCGLFVLVASALNLVQAIGLKSDVLFAEWGQLWRVTSVVIPAAIYVALVPYLGIYVASVFLIAVFMRLIGKYSWAMLAAVPLPVMVVSFMIFERWFLVPLPKGPIEEMLGF